MYIPFFIPRKACLCSYLILSQRDTFHWAARSHTPTYALERLVGYLESGLTRSFLFFPFSFFFFFFFFLSLLFLIHIAHNGFDILARDQRTTRCPISRLGGFPVTGAEAGRKPVGAQLGEGEVGVLFFWG